MSTRPGPRLICILGDSLFHASNRFLGSYIQLNLNGGPWPTCAQHVENWIAGLHRSMLLPVSISGMMDALGCKLKQRPGPVTLSLL